MKLLLLIGLMLVGPNLSLASEVAESDPVRVFTSEESFEDLVENIKMAIVDQGLLVSGTLHVSDMLNRTAADLGYSEIFSKAESVEFCSALISHKMAQAAAENIAICPFTIAVYVKKSEPEKVYASYLVPRLMGAGDEVSEDIVELLETILEESL
ncbi:MAG: hypothetical protein N0E59_18365 [Candidatus Thiodiazotropha taylori]|nr:hypothetical protein [Candidatus Thiodiazotropha taylori]MCG8107913.1 hypothetical protein [Candidatus Thiodiazotropha taylori]MCG8112725.1 hypothetical protein [Candidatus Thiodiazotropha taylori]MCW4280251.1 hypothetical protein [Candidatus Thiodiazotropha taylori]MCW4285083.1 hypothetical protein [Candidatus Thiodiazotropha taylori]